MNKYLYFIILILIPITVVSFLFKETNFSMEKDNKHSVDIQISVKKGNNVLSVPLEDYVIGVVAGEMPASFEIEALKAQAVASRTYVINHLKNSDTINGNIDDQVYLSKSEMQEKWDDKYDFYLKKIKEAVLETENEVIKYNGNVIKAYYYSESNGYTESSLNVFNEKIDYLNCKVNPYDNPKEMLVEIEKNDFCNKLGITCELLTINNISKDESNRVSSITINNKIFTGIEFRKLLNLRSTDFNVNIDEENIKILTKGYGHGVGMSQYGANNMAKNGLSYQEILKYYYENTEITNI